MAVVTQLVTDMLDAALDRHDTTHQDLLTWGRQAVDALRECQRELAEAARIIAADVIQFITDSTPTPPGGTPDVGALDADDWQWIAPQLHLLIRLRTMGVEIETPDWMQSLMDRAAEGRPQ